MTPLELEALKKALPNMSAQEKLQVLELLERYEKKKIGEQARNSLLSFVKLVHPTYKIGPHHKILAHRLEKAAKGEVTRLATSLAPRFGKSLLLSLYFPAWFMGNYPDQKLIISSHTTELAVDFGRKVRNLIDTDQYKEVFPGVTLSADSKSAGRWNTNANGEFYACIRPCTRISTTKGIKKAKAIKIGDVLLNAGTPNTVLQVYNSSHDTIYNIAGLCCSARHPIWTLNRGWVFAEDILSKDILRTESFLAKMRALLWRAYGALEHPDVPSLVQHQVSLRKSEQREISLVRKAWNLCLRALANIREFFTGYGGTTYTAAFSGQNRQQWAIQSGKLSLGDTIRTVEQSQNKRCYRRTDTSAKCSHVRSDRSSTCISDEGRCGSFVSGQKTAEELEAYSAPEDFGWGIDSIIRILTRCSRSANRTGRRFGVEKYLESCGETTQKLCGLLLGVRFAGKSTVKREQASFVNFLTDGDHTFFANGILTHNCGVGSAIAGRGADLLIIDDPFSEQDVLAGNYDVFDKVYEWYAYGARTRLMPNGRVVILHTRWSKSDLIGRILLEGAKNPEADQWDYIEFPAIMNEGAENEKSLWPEQWSLESLRRTRASMPSFQWQAQYQQSPISQMGALIKKDWWKIWKDADPPPCEYIIMTLDAAQETNKRADFSALTTWGIFYREDEDSGTQIANIILLNAINKRVEFPQLKELVLKEYKLWKPDSFIIEKKSNGAPLAQEMRRMGLPIQEYTPVRGNAVTPNTKFVRVNAIADIFRSGFVWAPEYKWAEEVIEQCNEFPSGRHDDLVDGTVMALMRFRSGGFITLPSDDAFEDDDPKFMPARSVAYY